MRGTECTQGQIDAASQFLADRGWPADVARAAQPRADIVRLLAWYGAMRYQAGRDGINSLENPGELVTKRGSSLQLVKTPKALPSDL